MNILKELIDDPKLAYHKELNPKLWDHVDTDSDGEHFNLKTEVSDRLLKIAYEFADTLGVPREAISDIVFTGSNANYNWTSLSDIDVHLMVDHDKLGECDDCKIDVEGCLQAKKSLWNDRHDISIFGHDVEVYASDAAQNEVADAGSYSLYNHEWITKPEHKNISIDSPAIKAKADEIAYEIDSLIDSKATDKAAIGAVTDKIWRMRQAGLQSAGEFSVENLVFKALRNNGYLDKIKKYQAKADDQELSLESVLQFPDRKKQVIVDRIKKALDEVPGAITAQRQYEELTKTELTKVIQKYVTNRREIGMAIRPLMVKYVKSADPIRVLSYELDEDPMATEYVRKHHAELIMSLSAQIKELEKLREKVKTEYAPKVQIPEELDKGIMRELYSLKNLRHVFLRWDG